MVIAAMRCHLAVTAVQEHACMTLLNLAANDDNRDKISSAGGIEMVIAAMRSHPAVAAAGLLGIVESCC